MKSDEEINPWLLLGIPFLPLVFALQLLMVMVFPFLLPFGKRFAICRVFHHGLLFDCGWQTEGGRIVDDPWKSVYEVHCPKCGQRASGTIHGTKWLKD